MRRRLLDRGRQRAEDYQLVLVRHGVERPLYRLSRSRYADRFILKGAMLFAAWEEAPHRPARDLDLLGRGQDAVSSVEQVVADLVRAASSPMGSSSGGSSPRRTVHTSGAMHAGPEGDTQPSRDAARTGRRGRLDWRSG